MKLNFKLITIIVMAGLSNALMGRSLLVLMDGKNYLSYGDDMFGYRDSTRRSRDEDSEKNDIKINREIIRRSDEGHYSRLAEYTPGDNSFGSDLFDVDESDQLGLAQRFNEFKEGFKSQNAIKRDSDGLENKKLAVEDIEKSIQHSKNAGNPGKAAALGRALEEAKVANAENAIVLLDIIAGKQVEEILMRSIKDKGFHYSRLIKNAAGGGLLDLDESSNQPRLAQRFKDFQEIFELQKKLELLKNRKFLGDSIKQSIEFFKRVRASEKVTALERELKAIGTPESEIDKIVQALTSKFNQQREGIIAAL